MRELSPEQHKKMLSTRTRRRQCRLLFLYAVVNIFVLTVICSSRDNKAPLLSRALFGVPRGGAFFGFGRKSSRDGSSDGDGGNGDGDGSTPKRFPGLSEEEIEDKLNIPIFGLTDEQGNGVVLSDSEKNSVFHFFFSKHMADAALMSVCNANKDAPPLRVSAFHLGKCWFKLINKPGSKEYKLKKYGGDDVESPGGEVVRDVVFRLVPNAKDLMGARILTGLKPGDVEQLKDAVEEPNPPRALSIIQHAAQSASASFMSPYDQIPVFAIAQMRVRRRDDEGNSIGEHMIPFHFSTKTMSDTWKHFVNEQPQFQDSEATLQLTELHTMIEMMQSESDFDFRNIVFIYPQYDNDANSKEKDESDDDESDDGGGGDNGMKSADNSDFVIEPFVSMGMVADSLCQTLVQL